jgi:hypothetical protein
MLGSCRSFALWAGAVEVAALASVSIPGAAHAQPVGGIRTPQFVATAVKFKALHETHWNWLGSDEVFAVFYDFTGLGERKTPTFGDVDAGETRNFSPPDSCISLQPTCDRGANSLGFGVALVEEDKGLFPFCHGALEPSSPPTSEDYERAFDAYTGTCPGDDLIGRAKVKLSQADLLAKLPHVGDSVDVPVIPTGGAGRYEFTYRLTRLADRLNIPPIGPPVTLVPFVLQAAVATNPTRVALTWTGASTSTVDIYRDGALIVTTANDGAYDDPRPSGTYRYHLCNLGSATDCTPRVTVVVP